MSEPQVSVAPRWIGPAFLGMALVLLPWIVWLLVTLPGKTVANHWQIAWGGFDVILALALAWTGLMLLRRSPVTAVAAAVTGTLLVVDAWFDVTTSRGVATVAFAAVLAGAIELPLAALCFWIARNVERVVVEELEELE
jgi:hypothetical protein